MTAVISVPEKAPNLNQKKNIIDFYTGIHKSFLLLIILENIINFVLSIYIL